MGKYKNALNSVYNGFMPVPQIRVTFVIVIALYLVFLGSNLVDNFSMQRFIRVENRQDGGIVAINGVKYTVPYTQINTLIPVKISNPVEFLFLSSGDMDESFFSGSIKIFTCLIILWLLFKIDLNDPFDPVHHKQINRITWMVMLIIITAYFKGFYTGHWFKQSYAAASGFQYSWGFGPFCLIPVVWLLRAIEVFYRSAVKTRQETEFTV